MNERLPTTQPDVKLKLYLRPSEPQEAGSDEDLVRLVQMALAGLPKLPRRKFRVAEFPSEIIEQVIADAEVIEGQTEAQEAALQANPPAPDDRAEMILATTADVIAAAQAFLPEGLSLRVRSEPVGPDE